MIDRVIELHNVDCDEISWEFCVLVNYKILIDVSNFPTMFDLFTLIYNYAFALQLITQLNSRQSIRGIN